MIMISAIYYEHRNKSIFNSSLKEIKEYIKESNVKKYLGIIALFSLLLFNIPIYYTWLYFRKTGYLAYEIYDYSFIFDFIGIENIIVSISFLLYIFLPIGLRFITDKKDRIAIIVGIILVYIMIAIFVIEQFFINRDTILSFLSLITSIGIIIFIRTRKKEFQTKYWYLGGISIVLLLILPFFFNQGLVKKSLFNANIGHFIVNTEDEKDICLLLRTTKNFYLKKYTINNLVFHSDGKFMFYIKFNIQENMLILDKSKTKIFYKINNKQYCT